MNDSQQTLEDSVRPIVSAPDFHAQEDREEDDTDIAAPYPAGTYIFVPDLKPLCVYDVTIEIDPPVLHEPMAPEWAAMAPKHPRRRRWTGTIRKIEGCAISDDGYVVSVNSDDNGVASRRKLISKIKRIIKARGYILGHTLDMTTMQPIEGFPPYQAHSLRYVYEHLKSIYGDAHDESLPLPEDCSLLTEPAPVRRKSCRSARRAAKAIPWKNR